MNDYMLRIVSADGKLRAMAASTTGLRETVCRLQQTDPTATVALSRTITGAALLGGLLKDKQRLALVIEGNGPLQKLHAETDAHGLVRGSIKVPHAELPPQNDRFDVPGAIGRAGFLHVIKDLSLKEPYRGMVQLQTSEIAEDLAYYLTVSEQVPSSVSLGVTLNQEAGIRAAGGLLVQAMPGCDDSTLEELEGRVAGLTPFSSLIDRGETAADILAKLFSGIPYHVSVQVPLQFNCTCNRDQVSAVLKSLGKDELQRLAKEEDKPSVTCEYCRQVYSFTTAEILALAG